MNDNYGEIIEKIAVLMDSGALTIELRRIKYPTSPEVFYDIRKWQHLPDGTEKMMRGISLSREAWERLREAMAQMDIDEERAGE